MPDSLKSVNVKYRVRLPTVPMTVLLSWRKQGRPRPQECHTQYVTQIMIWWDVICRLILE